MSLNFEENSGFFLSLKRETEAKELIPNRSLILVAFSGGADSLFLLCYLIWLQRFLDFKVAICHFNHGQRPGEDELAWTFAEELSLRFDIGLYRAKAGPEELPMKATEDEARQARFGFLRRVQDECETREQCPVRIALGHNLSDQAETVLLHMGRGTGLSGLTAMRAKENTLIRPLLGISATKIREFLKGREISYLDDSSNEGQAFLRNRVRQRLLPLWTEILGYDPSENIARLAANLQPLEDFVDNTVSEQELLCVQNSGILNLKIWKQQAEGLRTLILHSFVQRYSGHCLNHRQSEILIGLCLTAPRAASLDLAKGIRAEINGYKLWVELVDAN